MLRAIWALSVGLAVLAVLVMGVLILLRIASERRAARRMARREELLTTILTWLGGDVSDDVAKRHLAADKSLAADLLIEIFEMIRGEDRARLAMLSEQSGIPHYLRRTLRRGREAERLIAADTLVWFPSEETRAALRLALDDQDDEVGLTVAGSLVDLDEDLVLQRLVVFREERLAYMSRRLEAVLNRIAAKRPDDLVWLASDEQAPDRVRAAALDAVTQVGAFDLLDKIGALADSASLVVRAAVARSLGVFGHPGGEPAIARLLGDMHWQVRAEAAEAVGRIGLLSLGPGLCAFLYDENWQVRFRAANALAALGEGGIAALREIASSMSRASSQVAAAVLAERDAA